MTVLVGDPVGTGLAASLARPSGNVTGMSSQAVDIAAKSLEFLKEVAPEASRFVVLLNPNNPAHVPALKVVEDAGAQRRLTILPAEARTAGELDVALSATGGSRAHALLVFDDQVTFVHRRKIIDFAARQRLPAAYVLKVYVEDGGLMAYGPNIADLFRRAGGYVARLLGGARPGDLPIEQPTKFDLVINMKTARALGLTIPPSLLIRADQVLE